MNATRKVISQEEAVALVARCGSIRAAAREAGVKFDTIRRRLPPDHARLGGASGQMKADGPLSPECRRRIVEQFLVEYPDPTALLGRTKPALARTARRLGVTHDELLSDCYVAAARAARKYDPAGGQRFATFTAYEMWTVVRTTVNDRIKRQREQPYPEED